MLDFFKDPLVIGLTAAGTFLVFLVTFYNQAAVPLWNTFFAPFGRFVKSVADTPESVRLLSIQVGALVNEIKPNGGMSLKDSLYRLEESFSVAEGQRLLLMNSMKEAVFLANADGSNKWFNSAMLGLTGKESNDLVGDNWVNAVYQPDRNYVAEEWRRAISSKSSFDLTYRMINAKTNEIFKVHTVATPIFNFGNRIVGYSGVVYRYPTEITVEAAKITIETTKSA